MVRESLKPPFRSTPESKGNQSLAVWLKGRTTSVSQRIFFKEVGLIYSTFPHHWCFTKYSVHDWWLWTITSLCPSEVLFKAPVASPLTGSPRLGFSLSAKEEGDMSRSNDEEAGGSRRQSFLAIWISWRWCDSFFLLRGVGCSSCYLFRFFLGGVVFFSFFFVGGGGYFFSMLFVSSFVFCVCSSPVVCCLRWSHQLTVTSHHCAHPRWKQQRYCGELQPGEGWGGCFFERFFWSQGKLGEKPRGKSLNNFLETFLKMGKVEKFFLKWIFKGKLMRIVAFFFGSPFILQWSWQPNEGNGSWW